MSITSQDIADLAGVSRGTVDRVINDRPGVKPETRERIEKIIKDVGYVPSRAGKALSSTKKPVTIGIIINRGENKFFDDVIKGMEACKNDYTDFNLHYEYAFLQEYDVKEQLRAIRSMAHKNISFLIITPIHDPLIIQALNDLQETIPVITVNSDIPESRRMIYVGCDYFKSGQTAAGLLKLVTCQPPQVGIVAGSRQILGHRQRVEGFLSLLPAICVVESHDQDRRAYREVKTMLEEHPTINAIYFAAYGAEGGMQAVAAAEHREFTIITSDELDFVRHAILEGRVQATVCQEPFRQGYEAVNQGLQYLITGQFPSQAALYMKNEIKIAQNLE